MIEIGVFAAQALVVVLALGILIVLIAVLVARAQMKPDLEMEPLHKKHKHIHEYLESMTLETKGQRKKFKKRLKTEAKLESKEDKRSKEDKHAKEEKPKLFVIDFKGDKEAHQVDSLREEINAVLQIAKAPDEVLVKVESPGGTVHGYGLAAAQLLRLREKNLKLIVAVDKVAASGGYLMASTAQEIISSPFAIIGSIGVVASVPNFHRRLKNWDIDYKEYTSGEFKRTVSVLGEITPPGEKKFVDQLEAIHQQFKDFVKNGRPQVDIQKIATGEYWFGEQAFKLGLVDRIQTSDSYLLSVFEKNWAVYSLKHTSKLPFLQRISEAFSLSLEKAGMRFLEKIEKPSIQ